MFPKEIEIKDDKEQRKCKSQKQDTHKQQTGEG